MLDASAGWRCRGCVTRNHCGVSTLLDNLVGDDGKERLPIHWYKPLREEARLKEDTRCHKERHGQCIGAQCGAMAGISVGTRQDIGHDFTGLREDLVRRQAACTSRGADRHWQVRQHLASNNAWIFGTRHTHSWSR